MKINNPILPGFNPDPAMCFANGKYYIATSTFQYYPGITLYQTENFETIEQVSSPLTTTIDFELKGIDDSAGIWAPNILYHDGKFYITYTIVKSATGIYYDMENFVITATDINGPWSTPVQVNSGCFDPSLFFDEDKLYLFAKIVDHRYEPTNEYIKNYSGITLQQLDPITLKLIDDSKVITYGTNLGGEEGPQMFKRNGYYYLNIAEGGTEYNHQTTVLRSRNVEGPFTVHPHNPVLKSSAECQLQKAGHSSFVVDEDDNWLISHLCSRPISTTEQEGKYCPLGRETAIQNIQWIDDWPYVVDGRNPKPYFKIGSESDATRTPKIKYMNDDNLLSDKWFTLRQNTSQWNQVAKDHVIMQGKDSLMSKFDVNAYLTRVTNLECEFGASVEFNPDNYLQMAGITLYYDTQNYLTMFISHDQHYGKCIKIESVKAKKYSTLGILPISIDATDPIQLKFKISGEKIYMMYKVCEKWHTIDTTYNTTYLSDDYILKCMPSFFTGMLFGIYVSDLSGHEQTAKFSV